VRESGYSSLESIKRPAKTEKTNSKAPQVQEPTKTTHLRKVKSQKKASPSDDSYEPPEEF